jgi:hypothetical protein
MEASRATFQPRSCTGTCTQYITILDAYSSSWNTKCKYDCSKIPACSTHAQLVGPLTRAEFPKATWRTWWSAAQTPQLDLQVGTHFFIGVQQFIHGQVSILFPSIHPLKTYNHCTALVAMQQGIARPCKISICAKFWPLSEGYTISAPWKEKNAPGIFLEQGKCPWKIHSWIILFQVVIPMLHDATTVGVGY